MKWFFHVPFSYWWQILLKRCCATNFNFLKHISSGEYFKQNIYFFFFQRWKINKWMMKMNKIIFSGSSFILVQIWSLSSYISIRSFRVNFFILLWKYATCKLIYPPLMTLKLFQSYSSLTFDSDLKFPSFYSTSYNWIGNKDNTVCGFFRSFLLLTFPPHFRCIVFWCMFSLRLVPWLELCVF